MTTGKLDDRRLYLCTPVRDDLESFLEDCIVGGVDIVQLRDKSSEAVHVVAAARRALSVCADHGVPFIMNDRPDLALEVGAQGVHVGQDDATVALCRRILGDEALVGLSTHSPDEFAAGMETPATYLSAGPVVATPTQPGRAGTGIAFAAHAASTADRPVFVTGGVSPETVGELARAGLRHFVVVRHLTEANRPREAAAALRQAIDEALES